MLIGMTPVLVWVHIPSSGLGTFTCPLPFRATWLLLDPARQTHSTLHYI